MAFSVEKDWYYYIIKVKPGTYPNFIMMNYNNTLTLHFFQYILNEPLSRQLKLLLKQYHGDYTYNEMICFKTEFDAKKFCEDVLDPHLIMDVLTQKGRMR